MNVINNFISPFQLLEEFLTKVQTKTTFIVAIGCNITNLHTMNFIVLYFFMYMGGHTDERIDNT